LFFADDAARYALDRHEDFARSLCKLLGKAPEISAAAELVVRRCYFHVKRNAADSIEGADDSRAGYCLTFYLSGFGDDDAEARKRWAIGMKLVENAILQLAARSRV